MTLPQTVALVASAVSLYVALLSQRFSRAPGWRDQRFFALIALSAAAYTAMGALPDSLAIVAGHLQVFLAGLHIAAWVRFSAACVGRDPTRLERSLGAVLVVCSFLGLVPGVFLTGAVKPHTLPGLGIQVSDAQPTVAGLVVTLAFCGALFGVFLRFAAAWRRGTPQTALYMAGLGMLFLTAVNDVVTGAVQVGYPFLLSVGFMFPVGAVGYALTARFVASAQALERLSAQLETTVAERTQELAQAQAALHRAEKLGAIGRLSAGVAHEINNPAAVIAANLRYLKEGIVQNGAFPEDGVACLDDASASIDRISGVVRQLLEAGRAAGASAASPHAVGLAEAVAQAARLARMDFGERVTLVEAVPPDLFAMGEEGVLMEVLSNLIANAVQSIAPDRTDGRVELSAVRRGERIDLTVTDNGSGMSEETQRRLFEPFFSTKAFGEGTGLGLAVARGLVLGLGGDLRLVSTLGRGSTATVELVAAAAPG